MNEPSFPLPCGHDAVPPHERDPECLICDSLHVLVDALATAALCSELGKPVRAGQHLQVAHKFYADNARKWEIAGHAEYTLRAMQAVSSLDRALKLLWDSED